jgi:hypothetical protein
MLICGMGTQVLQVFRLSGLERFLSLHPTRQQALAALGVTAAT